MDPVLSRRALNRATLDRQLLIRRTTMPVIDVIEHLAGLQAQTPHSWYTGLWNRIEGFKAEQAADLLERREIVRIALQRSTIHLVSARDCLAMRPLVQIVTERMTRTTFGRKLAGVDLDELETLARSLLEDRAMTFAELGRALGERWPDNDQHALGQGVRWLVPLVQVPPRGLWGKSGPIAHTAADGWLGFETPPMTAGELVLRYLKSFGPASVKDVQTWSGLTRLGEVVASLDLVTYRDAGGRVLYDLPDIELPAEDLPVPVRFMYDFDNLFLSHEDRSRVVEHVDVLRRFVPYNVQPRTILVDGFPAGDWTTARSKGTTTLTIHRWEPFDPTEAGEEAARLLAFLAPGDRHEIVVSDGPSKV
ncbi:winged helix DNA-binding domain-containing protein [Nonomuraea sp. NPDC049152]|uniref:winged helix DNA-binding domain-containing protein n=1 Tax=Nonomuraea sp. NPDC049152 TaxID=3154350 RepID=UPI0033D2DC10